MAKILCKYSGIEYHTEFLPISLHSREIAHPIFYLPQKKLLGLFQKYQHNELNQVESYLTFLAYLHSTGLVNWQVPVKVTPKTKSIVANNFHSLVSIAEKINRIYGDFARIAITPDTCTLDNIKYWIANWEITYEEFISKNEHYRKSTEIHKLEEKLEYLCKDANRNEVLFASRLAEWAEKAGDFPRFAIKYLGEQVSLASYWKLIIRKCVNQESIISIPEKDLQELIDHCEENIEAGSIYAFHLFKILKEGKEKQSSFLGLGSFEFSFVPQDTSVEEANRLAIINNAPKEAPKEIDYPSKFQYLKAKLAWEMAQNSTQEK